MSYTTHTPQSETHVVPAPTTSSLTKHFSYKMNSLYEIKYLDNKSCLPTTNLTFLNPYHNYLKPLTFLRRTLNTLIHPSAIKIKEYVQSTSFSSYQLPASTAEQYITLKYPSHFTQEWISKGYTHLHFGAIRFTLTFHGRKRLPTTSQITLLDTRFPNFEHTNLRTVQTTLNARTVMVTLFPNFCMSLQDPLLCHALKFQVQVTGTVPQGQTLMATIHYQIAYRVQNHSLDIVTPDHTHDAIFLTVDTNRKPYCILVPKQMPKEQLEALIPKKWYMTYEQIQTIEVPPIQYTDP